MDDDLVDRLLNIVFAIDRGEMPPYEQNEYFTSGAFDLLSINKRGNDVFELLEAVCGRYDDVKGNPRRLAAYFGFLENLAYLSDTTECPEALKPLIDENPGLSAKLKSSYRM